MFIQGSIYLSNQELRYLTAVSQVGPQFGDPVSFDFSSGRYTVSLPLVVLVLGYFSSV